MQTIKLKLNRSMKGQPTGSILTLKVDAKGVIIDPFWRARLLDSKLDQCVELYQEKPARRSREDITPPPVTMESPE